MACVAEKGLGYSYRHEETRRFADSSILTVSVVVRSASPVDHVTCRPDLALAFAFRRAVGAAANQARPPRIPVLGVQG